MFDKLTQSPLAVRAIPFGVFIALTSLQGLAGDEGRYWIYLAKTVAGALTLALFFRHIQEFRWCFSWPALAAGVGVFALWIGLEGHYPPAGELYRQYVCPWLEKLRLVKACAPEGQPPLWNPNSTFGEGSTLAVFFLVVRIVGAALVVPAIEEIFWRSFVYRYVADKDFDRLPLRRFYPVSFAITCLLFGFEHREWLPGILCGAVYQGLVIWKGRLGDALTAHAITNFLLGLWVVWKGAWHFW
jgi:membrane protease YdiL (CAAX protease family)